MDRYWTAVNQKAYVQVQFKLTNRVIEYERVIYSFFEMAGDIGGFGQFLKVTFVLMFSGYANRMFLASVISDMFKVRLSTGNTNVNELTRQFKTKQFASRSRTPSLKTGLAPAATLSSSRPGLNSARIKPESIDSIEEMEEDIVMSGDDVQQQQHASYQAKSAQEMGEEEFEGGSQEE